MPHCEFCGDEIGYLPFKCKYCGGIYCKKHRLPENHECSFELKHTPVIPTTSRQTRPLYQDIRYKKGTPRTSGYKKPSQSYFSQGKRRASDFRNPKQLKRYLERERRQREHAMRIVERSLMGRGGGPSAGEAPGTTFLILMIVIFSITATILSILDPPIPHYIAFSAYGLEKYYIWIIFTAPFVSYSSDMFGLFFLFILIFFFLNIARSIELRYGTKFLIGLYLFCAIFTALFYLLIRYILVIAGFPTYLDYYYMIPIGLASGAILGIISFLIFPEPDRELVLFCFFIPIKMKGRLLLIIFILYIIIPGLLFGLLISPLYFALYFHDLGGIFASYIVYYYKVKK
ncbi:MAG: AN1-type zinc finger domain-containing protein [Promethearchaeota archaeon]